MEINVDSILQGLKDGKSTRTQQSLDTLNGILQHYVESGQRDFSVVQIGRISAAKDQGESVNILLNFTQFFETRIEYRFQIFTAHSCDFLLPSYARLA